MPTATASGTLIATISGTTAAVADVTGDGLPEVVVVCASTRDADVGHAAVLADVGFFPRADLDDFNKTGSPFGMDLDRLKVKGGGASTR